MTTEPTGRGGWRGGGRPRAAPTAKLLPYSVRLTAAHQAKYRALGGEVWLRDAIEWADIEAAVEPDTSRAPGDGPEQRLPMTLCLDSLHRAKLAKLGGVTWLRLLLDAS